MIDFNHPWVCYRVEDGPCHEILLRWRDQRNKIATRCWAFAESVGGSGYVPGHDDAVVNAVAINAIIFSGDLPKGWKPKELNLATPLPEGKRLGWPDQRTKVGKAAMAAIKALPVVPSTRHARAEIGFPPSLTYRGNSVERGSHPLGLFDTLKVGWLEDVLFVALPDENDARRKLEAKGYTVDGDPWQPMPEMVEILREEMDLEFAKAKAAKAKVAA